MIKIGKPDMFFGSVLSFVLVQRCAHATFPRDMGANKKGKVKIHVVYQDTILGALSKEVFHMLFWDLLFKAGRIRKIGNYPLTFHG